MVIKPAINWLGITTFMVAMAGIVWAGSEKLAEKANQRDVEASSRKIDSIEARQQYIREDLQQIREDIRQILQEVRKKR